MMKGNNDRHSAARKRVRTNGAGGYSGTPLVKKLGIKASCRLAVIDEPADYERLLAPLPAGVEIAGKAGPDVDAVHLFVTEKQKLAKQLAALRKKLAPEAAVWVSWPKKASKVPTTVTEDVIREVALPLGFVDIKVCAVTDVWSGLKLVVRKELR
jgi:hypothetical protein